MDDPRDVAVRARLKAATKGKWEAVEDPEKPGTFYVGIRGARAGDPPTLLPGQSDTIVATLTGKGAAEDAALLAQLKEDLEWAMGQIPHLREMHEARAADALAHGARVAELEAALAAKG